MDLGDGRLSNARNRKERISFIMTFKIKWTYPMMNKGVRVLLLPLMLL